MIGRDIKEVGVRLCFEDDQPTDWRRRLRSFLAHGPLGPFVGRLLDRGR